MDFYYMDVSPYCRSVMLTAKAIGVDLNKKVLNLMEGAHMKPEFLAINPQHCIPTLVDGGLKLWESRAICTYLISKYGKEDSLYPKDPEKRVVIDKLLCFDMGTLADRMRNYFRPAVFENTAPDPEKKKRLEEALGWFNGYLEGQQFCAGNSLTVADFVLIATVSTIIEADLADVSKYSNILPWVKRCQTTMVGYETENDKGAKMLGDFIKSKFAAYQ